MAPVSFDPRRHPRTRQGKFSAALEKLADGDRLTMPHGGTVRKVSPARYELGGSAKANRIGVPLPSMAAARMLNDSAQSDHPESLGGPRRYTSHDHFMQRERKVEDQRAQIAKSRAGAVKK